jgi:hypothetical protein
MAKSHRFYHAIRPHLGVARRITSAAGKKCYQTAFDFTRRARFFAAGLRLWYVPSMQSSSNQRPFHIYGTRDRKTAFGATDFLRANDRLAALMPTALRVGNLQRDVKNILPPMYAGCDVLSFQDAVLTLAVPSSAVAAKLKQQLPKLQANLQKKGWQVENVRIKIQMRPNVPVREELKPSSLTLPPTAVDAFEQLGETLPETPQNAALIAAIKRLAERRKK